MYSVTRTVIKKGHPLYGYCLDVTSASKRLYNAALFRIRNRFTGYHKIALTDNELEVLSELNKLALSGKLKATSSSVLNYNTLEKLMRVTKNPDFFSGILSMQAAQHAVRDAAGDFKNWLKALKAYKKDPSGFLGKPQMPHYKKAATRTTELTNQDCRLKDGYLKLPLTDTCLKMENIPDSAILKCVKIKPYYEGFLILCSYETEDIAVNADYPFMAGIDFGVDNIAAITTNEGHTLLFKGGVIKAENQYFNKERARLISCVTKGHETTHAVSTHRLMSLSMHRDAFLRDEMHKISNRIVEFCKEHRIGTLVLGVNKLWKRDSNLGDSNNQNFVQIPFAVLRFMITYKAERAGIAVVEQEESYTSKSDFLSRDAIPTYGVDDSNVSFSGSRVHRGLYKSGTGVYVNADLNGAANILRKAIPYAFDNVEDFAYLQNPKVIRFSDLNRKGKPDEGVVAA